MSVNRQQRRALLSTARHRKSTEWVSLPIDPALFERAPACRNIVAAWRNDFWIVQVYHFASGLGPMTHLTIRSVAQAGQRSGQEPTWQELQAIKNELVGRDYEAVQVYPRADDVMDQVDMYHLFVMPLDWVLPFGLHRENGFARPRLEWEGTR